MRIGIALRTDVFDRQTPRLLTVARPSLVTNMGAGLCTRYYGLGQPAIDWIEVDVPDVNCVTAQRAAGDEHHRMIAR
jgi:O-methyltransferase involved in polyketide biosynthesis